MKTGIIAALRSEAECLAGETCDPLVPLQLSPECVLVLSGMGEDRLEKAFHLLQSENIQAVVSFGTAAALSPTLNPGDLVVPESLLLANNTRMDLASDWRDGILKQLGSYPFQVHGGDMTESAVVLGEPSEKNAAFESTGAVALDMESGFIGITASSLGLPMLVVRIVVDDAFTVLPNEVLDCCDEFGKVNAGRLLMAIVKRPSLIGNLVNLGKHFARARKGMTWVSRNVSLSRSEPG